MRIAQITDIHIGFDQGNPDENNAQRLRAVLDRLIHGPAKPDLLILSGDLTEFGDAESYARLVEMLEPCPFPVWPIAGNHDDREALLKAFPILTPADGFAQFVLDLPGLRLIGLDTLEPGRHGGGFCEVRAAWLRAQLLADRTTPVVIAMHHPPFESGIAWLDCAETEPWIDRFADAIAGHSQVKSIFSGHLHRAIYAMWNEVGVSVCPSTAAAVALDLDPHPPGSPDGRAMITDEPAGYALHFWNGTRLISHYEPVSQLQPWRVFAQNDIAMQDVVWQIHNERTE